MFAFLHLYLRLVQSFLFDSAMAKGSKKKDLDFQKVKLKIGRKLKRDSNETKAEFKTRKIILREVKSHSDDPITALAHHSDHISQHGKLSLLNHFNSALTLTIVKALTKPIVDSLAKFIIDHSEPVRTATYRCLKTCFNHMKQRGMSTKEFAYLLKPYLDCAFTHIDRGISQDCLKFLDYLTNTNEPQVFEPMMHVVLRRYEVGNLTSKELNIAQKIKHLYLKHQKRVNQEIEQRNDQIEPLVWAPTNCLLDLDLTIHKLAENYSGKFGYADEREVSLVPRTKVENVVDKFLQMVPDLSDLDLEGVDQRKQQVKRFRSI